MENPKIRDKAKEKAYLLLKIKKNKKANHMLSAPKKELIIAVAITLSPINRARRLPKGVTNKAYNGWTSVLTMAPGVVVIPTNCTVSIPDSTSYFSKTDVFAKGNPVYKYKL